MEALAKQIERRMYGGRYKRAMILDKELERVWPVDQEDRKEKIVQFATKYGFRLRYYQKGMGAIFDKWPPEQGT